MHSRCHGVKQMKIILRIKFSHWLTQGEISAKPAGGENLIFPRNLNPEIKTNIRILVKFKKGVDSTLNSIPAGDAPDDFSPTDQEIE
jgi:hypothetical protein